MEEWGVEKLAKAKLIVSSARVSSQMQVVVLDAESRKRTSFIDGWDVFTDFPEFSDQNCGSRCPPNENAAITKHERLLAASCSGFGC